MNPVLPDRTTLTAFLVFILASWLAIEQITLQFLAGGTLVILGVWVGALWVPSKK